MKRRLVYNWKLLPKAYGAITIYPFVLITMSSEETPQSLITHEFVHCDQVEKVGWFRFYISYLIYYIAGLIQYFNHDLAYLNIPYEIEAREITKRWEDSEGQESI